MRNEIILGKKTRAAKWGLYPLPSPFRVLFMTEPEHG